MTKQIKALVQEYDAVHVAKKLTDHDLQACVILL